MSFMPMEIKEIKTEKEWRYFENENSPHTFLQTWEWGRAQELLGAKIFRLGIYQDGKLCGTAFAYTVRARRGSFLFCPHGPSIDWCDAEQFKAIVKYFRGLAKKEDLHFVRLSSLAPKTEEMKTLFREEGFSDAPVHMMHPENAWILDITPDENALMAQMKKRTRYSIRKAEKDGVTIKTSADPKDVGLFYEMYLETAKRQKFVPFSKNYIMREFEIFEKSGKSLIFFAYLKDKLISAAVIIFSGKMAFYHHGASIRLENSGITASELLQWQVILEAKRRGNLAYNFWGIAPPEAKSHPWLGLTTFKKGFGGYAEDYLHCQDLVLSRKYWLNYIVEAFRTLKRGY